MWYLHTWGAEWWVKVTKISFHTLQIRLSAATALPNKGIIFFFFLIVDAKLYSSFQNISLEITTYKTKHYQMYFSDTTTNTLLLIIGM